MLQPLSSGKKRSAVNLHQGQSHHSWDNDLSVVERSYSTEEEQKLTKEHTYRARDPTMGSQTSLLKDQQTIDSDYDEKGKEANSEKRERIGTLVENDSDPRKKGNIRDPGIGPISVIIWKEGPRRAEPPAHNLKIVTRGAWKLRWLSTTVLEVLPRRPGKVGIWGVEREVGKNRKKIAPSKPHPSPLPEKRGLQELGFPYKKLKRLPRKASQDTGVVNSGPSSRNDGGKGYGGCVVFHFRRRSGCLPSSKLRWSLALENE